MTTIEALNQRRPGNVYPPSARAGTVQICAYVRFVRFCDGQISGAQLASDLSQLSGREGLSDTDRAYIQTIRTACARFMPA